MSKQSLDQLIESLKAEAVEGAEKKSKKILESARSQAQEIIREAEAKRQQILADAEKEAQGIHEKGQSALQQAARDLLISVQNDLLQLLGAALDREIQKEFKPELVKKAIVKVLENVGSQVELEMSEAFVKELATYIHDRFQHAEDLVSITTDHHRLNHFSIKRTDQGWSYEISPEEVSILLQAHLTEQWVKILKKEAKAS